MARAPISFRIRAGNRKHLTETGVADLERANQKYIDSLEAGEEAKYDFSAFPNALSRQFSREPLHRPDAVRKADIVRLARAEFVAPQYACSVCDEFCTDYELYTESLIPSVVAAKCRAPANAHLSEFIVESYDVSKYFVGNELKGCLLSPRGVEWRVTSASIHSEEYIVRRVEDLPSGSFNRITRRCLASLRVCRSCRCCLNTSSNRPKRAICNGLWIGAVPNLLYSKLSAGDKIVVSIMRMYIA